MVRSRGNGIDDDGDGYVDDRNGWDFVNSDAHPNDDNGHGTHITGTIAESTNNSLAAAGLAFETTIMPLKVLNSAGNGTTTTIAAAVNYAAAHGADIINLSLGGNDDDPVLQAALQAAAAKGILIMAAAGNGGGGAIDYPAAYREVVAVGATQYDNTRAPYSDVGSQLDLMAPGGNLLVDQNSDGYMDGIPQQTCTTSACTAFGTALYSGTSQATAQVSAAAALLEACGAASGSVIGYLESTARDLGSSGWDSQYGYGLIQVDAALAAAGCSASAPSPPNSFVGYSPAPTTRLLQQNESYPYAQPRFTWSGPTGATYLVQWGKIGALGTAVQQVATSLTPTLDSEGVYQVAVQTVDARGQTSAARTFTWRYRRPVIIIGQTSADPGIRFYRPDPAFFRAWPAQLQSAVVQVAAGPLDNDGTIRIIATGQYFGTSVKILSTQGQQIHNLVPFGSNYRGSIDAAVLRRPGQGQLAVATRSEDAQLRWYDDQGRLTDSQTLYAHYRGGLELASGDIDGDGVDELIVTMSHGHEVRVYNWQHQRISVFSPLGSKWTGGFAVTTGDLDGDGNQEIIVTPREGGGNAPVFLTTLHGVVKASWRLYTGRYHGEMDIFGLDVDQDGYDELVAVGKTGATFAQYWTLDGHLYKQYDLFTDGRGSSLGGLR